MDHATMVGPLMAGSKEDDVSMMDELLIGSDRFSGSRYDKREICCVFEATGFCPLGAMCEFAHGIKELRGSATKCKPEVEQSANSKPTFGISTATAQQNKTPQMDEDKNNNHDAELINDYITRVLHGPYNKRRLPVFAEICPE